MLCYGLTFLRCAVNGQQGHADNIAPYLLPET